MSAPWGSLRKSNTGILVSPLDDSFSDCYLNTFLPVRKLTNKKANKKINRKRQKNVINFK